MRDENERRPLFFFDFSVYLFVFVCLPSPVAYLKEGLDRPPDFLLIFIFHFYTQVSISFIHGFTGEVIV